MGRYGGLAFARLEENDAGRASVVGLASAGVPGGTPQALLLARELLQDDQDDDDDANSDDDFSHGKSPGKKKNGHAVPASG